MVLINFHKFLRPYVNNKKSIEIEANTYLDIMLACSGLFPEFYKLIKKCTNKQNKHEEIAIIVNDRAIEQEEVLFEIKKDSTITIVPIIYGSGKIGTYIGIAIAVIVVVVVAWYALPGIIGGLGVAAGSGLGAAAGGVAGGAAGSAAVAAGLVGGGVAGAVAAGGLSLSSLALLALGVAFNLVLMLLAPKIGPPKAVDAVDAGQRRNNDIFDALSNSSVSTPLMLNYGLNRIAGQFVSGYVKTINHGPNDIIKIGNEFIQ